MEITPVSKKRAQVLDAQQVGFQFSNQLLVLSSLKAIVSSVDALCQTISHNTSQTLKEHELACQLQAIRNQEIQRVVLARLHQSVA